MKDVQFRNASLEEVRLMLAWASKEGWNPGQEDAAAFHAADPAGFFVAVKDDEPVAAISVVNQSDDLAFLGLYLCRPEFRGLGIGYGLWNHAIAHAGTRTIGLDGVPEQEANYAKSGFSKTGSTRRWQGRLPQANLQLEYADKDDVSAMLELDEQANGFNRKAFIEAWTTQTDTRKTVLLKENGKVSGFATARLCGEGCKIGPIIASSVAAAIELAVQAAAALGQNDVIIDTPASANDFETHLEGLGFVETFSTARMYRGPAPAVGTNLHAIATMELG